MCINILLLLLTNRGRLLVLNTVETILAVTLVLILVGVVLGLPLVTIYLSFVAISFLGHKVPPFSWVWQAISQALKL